MAIARVAVRFLPFHVPCIDEDDINAVVKVLRTGWITTGPKVAEFENAFATFLGARHAIAVSSCTAALHLALDAIGLKEHDEVLLPTLTFAATAEVVTYFKAKPVLVDCEPTYFTIDSEALDANSTPRTRAVIPVHLAGHPCNMTDIRAIADRNGLRVIEDGAHAFPAKYEGQYIGTLSPVTAFSFYATKTLTTGEGGMITTDDDALATRMRSMRLHGMNADAWKRYAAIGTWRYDIADAGYKYNLTDLSAALGVTQLAKSLAMWRRRAEIAGKYERALRGLDAYQVPTTKSHIEHAWHLYVILIRPERLRIGRDEVIMELKKRGIGTAVHFIPLHLFSYYQRRWGYRSGQFPVAEWYFNRCISLPLYPTMADEDVELVVEALGDIAHTFES
jgi:dTDP-4-amino-4,6-dideoxygalactose transaminase